MPHRRCVVCEPVVPARGLKRLYPKDCLLPSKPSVIGSTLSVLRAMIYITAQIRQCRYHFDSRDTSIVLEEAREFEAARVKVSVLSDTRTTS